MPKDWGTSECMSAAYRVSLFSRHLRQPTTEDKVVALGSQSDSHATTHEDEGENISILCKKNCEPADKKTQPWGTTYFLAAFEEKVERVLAIRCCRTEERNPVEHKRW